MNDYWLGKSQNNHKITPSIPKIPTRPVFSDQAQKEMVPAADTTDIGTGEVEVGLPPSPCILIGMLS